MYLRRIDLYEARTAGSVRVSGWGFKTRGGMCFYDQSEIRSSKWLPLATVGSESQSL